MTVGIAAGSVLASRRLVHYFQLESYQFRGYRHTVARNWTSAFEPGFCLALAGFVLTLLLRDSLAGHLAVGAALAALGVFFWLLDRKHKEKKPLRMTARVKRLLCALALLSLLLAWALGKAGLGCFYPALLPLWLALAALAVWPVERGIYELYFQDARRVLDRHPDLIRIGITGSYGKTSVKFILGTLLSERYQTLVTPASFNTPMGLASVIRGRMQPGTQVFVAEMGARHRGDIRELCRLVHPRYGVLTSVGPQHLDTFGTLEHIRETKYDLIRSLPADGCAFFAEDGGICRELYDRTAGPKRLVSLHREEGADLWAEDVRVSASGSHFELCAAGEKISCATQLLGEHSIANILLAASVCRELGMSLREIARGIARLQPVEHRLQLLHGLGGMTIIDDAFNANPHGLEAALRVLAQFPARRIIVTPGLVELGREEDAYNRKVGEEIAASADIAVLVGRRHTAPIAEGLRAAGFPEDSLHVVDSLDAASALLGKIGRTGDTVLFENDLPDNYRE